MTMSNLSENCRHALLPIVVGAAAMALSACNGGGVTAEAALPPPSGAGTPYILFASNYQAYAAETNGAFIYSYQNGDVIAKFNGNYGYGCFSSQQADMDRTQFYQIQAQANSDGGPPNGSNCQVITNIPPTTVDDFFFLAIKAPGTNTTALIAPVDISQSDKLLIQMGNTVTPSNTPPKGNANVFTVTMISDTVGDGSALTAKCFVDQTLAVVGGDNLKSALGVINYVIPFSSFTCDPGSIETLKSDGVTTVSIAVVGDKNPNVVVGEFDTIAVGYVGFSK